MWFVYRFARNTQTAPPSRELDADIAAFSNTVVQRFGQPATWVAASARAPDGGIEVWYSLPQLPTDPVLKDFWAQCLSSYGLAGQRITNR